VFAVYQGNGFIAIARRQPKKEKQCLGPGAFVVEPLSLLNGNRMWSCPDVSASCLQDLPVSQLRSAPAILDLERVSTTGPLLAAVSVTLGE
jgi:hypothetical protein